MRLAIGARVAVVAGVIMHELQTRVANRIFPKVAAELNKQTDAFGEFVDKYRKHLQTLSSEATETIARLEIGG